MPDETIPRDFSPSSIGRWGAEVHKSAETDIGAASGRLVDAFSKKTALLADGDRERLVGYVKGLKEELDEKKTGIIESLDEATGSYKTAREDIQKAMARFGGSYDISFAKKFNESRAEADRKCKDEVSGQVALLDGFTTQVAGVSDIAGLKKLINKIGEATDKAGTNATKLAEGITEDAAELATQFRRDIEGFGPKKK